MATVTHKFTCGSLIFTFTNAGQITTYEISRPDKTNWDEFLNRYHQGSVSFGVMNENETFILRTTFPEIFRQSFIVAIQEAMADPRIHMKPQDNNCDEKEFEEYCNREY